MGVRSKSNVPQAALRWSPERAAIEFGFSTATLRKALNKNSAAPDKEGLFTTQQIAAAIYGALPGAGLPSDSRSPLRHR
jgi:hypothetical protein